MLLAKKSFWGRKPGFDTGDLLHIVVNIGFSIVLGAMVLIWQLTPLAMVLILLSKWRTFAVQPRFWITNIKANLVDVIVGISSVGLMHQASETNVAYAWIILYAVWLLFIKPRSSTFWIGLQSIIAQTLGLIMLFGSMELVKQSVVVSILAWVVAWAAARHYFSNYEEPHYRALSLLWGFIVAQTVWYSLHWVQYFSVAGLLIASVSIFITIISITLGSLYNAYRADKLTKNLVIENTVLSVISVFALLISSGWKSLL